MRRLFFLVFISTAIAGNSYGMALSNDQVGLRASLMQGAFAGIADDSSAIFYNPAGLAMRDKNNWDVQAYAQFLTPSFKIGQAGSPDLNSSQTYTIPGVFISKKSDNVAFGLGCYAPYGGAGYRYNIITPNPAPGLLPTTRGTLSSLLGIYAITPSFAYQISSSLSVGLGISGYYGTENVKLTDHDLTAYGFPDTLEEIALSSMAGYGANVGLMYKASDAVKIGIEVRGPVSMKLSGTTKTPEVGMFGPTGNLTEIDSSLAFNTPFAFNAGVGYAVNPDLLLSLDIWYETWGNTADMTQINTVNGVSASTDIKTYYKNFAIVAAGVDYQLTSGLNLLGGLSYAQGGLSDDGFLPQNQQTFAGLACDTDNLGISVGVGYDVMRELTVDVGVADHVGLDKKISGPGYDLTYHENVLIITAGLSARF